MSSVRAVSMIMGTSGKFPNGAAGGQPVDLGIMTSSTMSRMSGSRASSMASRAVAAGDDLIWLSFCRLKRMPFDQQLFIIYDQYFHGSSSTVTSFAELFQLALAGMPSTAMSSSTLR